MEITTVTGSEIPLQDDPAYVQSMIDKANGIAPTQEPTESNAEKLYAGKYKSVEEMEKGYLELQKAFSGKRLPQENTNEADASQPQQDPLAIPTPEGNENAQQVLEDRGLDFNTFSEEWRTSGQLSPESYEKLQKAGIPQEMVDAYIEGQQVLAQQATTRIYDTAGGQEEYSKIVQWAAQNLPKADIEAYNAAIASENVEQMVLATRGLKATFEEHRGKTPQLIDGYTSGDASRGDSFNSLAQMKAAMADPRYQKDSAYREEVIKKLSRSSIM